VSHRRISIALNIQPCGKRSSPKRRAAVLLPVNFQIIACRVFSHPFLANKKSAKAPFFAAAKDARRPCRTLFAVILALRFKFEKRFSKKIISARCACVRINKKPPFLRLL
jgi:hypothetical protein